MGNDPQGGIRPAGAPMVPMARPGEGDASPLLSEAMDEARDAGHELTDRTRERVLDELGRGSSAAGARVHAAAGDVRDMAAHLHDRRRDAPARLADEIADRLDRAGAYLTDAEADRMVRDARDFARRRPAVVLAGAAVAGLVLGRVARVALGQETAGQGAAR